MRKYTTLLLEMIEDGLLNERDVILALLNYMSEKEVQDMMESEGFMEADEEEEDDTESDEEEEDDTESDEEEEKKALGLKG